MVEQQNPNRQNSKSNNGQNRGFNHVIVIKVKRIFPKKRKNKTLKINTKLDISGKREKDQDEIGEEGKDGELREEMTGNILNPIYIFLRCT